MPLSARKGVYLCCQPIIMTMAYDVYQIANSLLRLADDQCDPMINMKLQKMLYYEQGYHLAYFGMPLLREEIRAWFYGPVVPCVYNKYKVYENKQIEADESISDVDFKDDDEWAVFRRVFDVFSVYSATGLINMTRSEEPWLKADVNNNEVITKASMKRYFKKRVERKRQEMSAQL